MSSLFVKKMVKAVLPPALDSLGIYDRVIRTAERKKPIWLVVMYHRVIAGSAEDPFEMGMCVATRRFRKQMQFYRDYFEPIPLTEGVRRRREGQPMPDRAVSITFDDGYADNLGIAWPILREYGIPATVFVTTGGRSEDYGLWWDRVIHAVANTGVTILDLSSLGIEDIKGKIPLSRSERKQSLTRLLSILWQQDIDKTMLAIEQLEKVLQPQPSTATLPARLTDEDIAKLHNDGMEIGAHTITHPDLRMTTDKRLQRELLLPKQLLESITGEPVNGFAYPKGLYDERVRNAVEEAGYHYAVGTVRGLNRGSETIFGIERMGAPDTSVADLKRCIAGSVNSGNGLTVQSSITRGNG